MGCAALADGLCPGEEAGALKMRQRIVREWPLRPYADEASRYVQALGQRLADNYDGRARAISWRFTLVRNLAPNAFSIGAGNVFVTEGAVTFAQNEAELAAILAHELGHELAGHFCEGSYTDDSRGLFDIFSDSTPPPRSESVGVGSMRQSIEPLKEQQADQYAVSILRASGYDPRAMLEVARRLPTGGEAHFADTRRVQSLERLLGRFPTSAEPKDSEQFRHIRRLLMAEAPHR